MVKRKVQPKELASPTKHSIKEFYNVLVCPRCGTEYDYRLDYRGKTLPIMQWNYWSSHTTPWGEKCSRADEHIHAECRTCGHHWMLEANDGS